MPSTGQLEKRLGYEFTDLTLLQRALTHRSAGSKNNERLEFLGDSVLGIVVAEYLYSQFSDRAEGELAKAKAVAVSEPVLGESARSLIKELENDIT